jgi:hypothetical protein
MDIYKKDYNIECFEKHIAKILSLYCKATNQEDYTKAVISVADMNGAKYKAFRSKNWEMLDALERAKVLYRSAMAK